MKLYLFALFASLVLAQTPIAGPLAGGGGGGGGSSPAGSAGCVQLYGTSTTFACDPTFKDTPTGDVTIGGVPVTPFAGVYVGPNESTLDPFMQSWDTATLVVTNNSGTGSGILIENNGGSGGALQIISYGSGSGASPVGISLDAWVTQSGVSPDGIDVGVSAIAGLTVPSMHAIHISSPQRGSGTVITEDYGIIIDNRTAATSNWAIKTGLGKVDFGDTVKAAGYLSSDGTAGTTGGNFKNGLCIAAAGACSNAGTVTSIATTGPIGGGTITSTGTITCTTCATTTNGGALSATSPVTISAAGVIACATCSTTTGTVTSVGFTGGLISVGTPTTTPAFTVAGTSGGIPYFSGATTWASSGAGVQNDVIAWGGAGNAPVDTGLLYTNLAKVNAANNFTVGPQNITLNAIGTSQTDGWEFYNTTAAANNAQQISPSITFQAAGWNTTATAASNTIFGYIQLLGAQGSATGGSSAAGVDGLFQFQNKIGANGVKNIMQLGQQFGSGGNGVLTSAMWLGNVTATTTNWILGVDANATYINVPASNKRIGFGSAGTGIITFVDGSPGHVGINAADPLGWPSSGGPEGTLNVAFGFDSSGIINVNNGTAGTTAANYRAVALSALYSKGTTFTASGCSNGTLVGGATAGKMTLGAASCTVVVTMGNSATAPTGWSCSVEDQTTVTALVSQSASTTTTASFSVPVTAGGADVLVFHCLGY